MYFNFIKMVKNKQMFDFVVCISNRNDLECFIKDLRDIKFSDFMGKRYNMDNLVVWIRDIAHNNGYNVFFRLFNRSGTYNITYNYEKQYFVDLGVSSFVYPRR